MTLRRLTLTLAIGALLFPVQRLAAEGCKDVLTITGRDVTESRHLSAFSADLYNKHCGDGYSSSAGDGALEIFGVLSLGGSSNKERRDRFCKQHEEQRSSMESSQESSSLVVQEAIKAWNSCQHLKAQGLDVQYVQVDSSHVVVGLRRGGTPAEFEGAIYDDAILSCDGRTAPGEAPVGIGDDSFFPLPDGKLWNLRCTRLPTRDHEGTVVSGGTLTLVTSQGNLAVPLPPTRRLTAATSIDLLSEIAALREHLARQAELLTRLEEQDAMLVPRSWLVEADRLYSDPPWREIVRLKQPDSDGHAKALSQGWKKVGRSLMVVVPPAR